MPRNNAEYEAFKEKEIIPFLLHSPSVDLLANADLMQEYARLRNIRYEALITPKTDEYKKHINYFRCLRQHIVVSIKPELSEPEQIKQYETFKEEKIIPFLSKYEAEDLIKNEELMQEYAKIQNLDYATITEPDTPEYKKHLTRFASIRIIIFKQIENKQKKENLRKEKLAKKNIKIQRLHIEKTEVINNLEPFKIPKIEEQRQAKKTVFKHNLTGLAFEGLDSQVEFLKNARKDLTYFLQGGTEEEEITYLPDNQQVIRKRLLTPFIEEYKALNVLIEKNGISKGRVLSPDKQKHLLEQLRLIEGLALSPFKILEKITEMSFQAQRELQGVILNDQALPETQSIKDTAEQEKSEKFVEVFSALYNKAEEVEVFSIEKKK